VTVESRSAELVQEQAYFDIAAKHRERRLATLADVPVVGAHRAAAIHLKRYAKVAADAIGSADSAVAFGRIDDHQGERRYIGRHLIRDSESEVLVVNWQSPAAARYFEASHGDPHGLRRKRTFECEGNRILDFADVVFMAPAQPAPAEPAPAEPGAPEAPAAAGVDEPLLRELASSRTGRMRDIVATIQAAQYDIIRAPLDRVLVIEGGPGTGKTAVALHRVSWLLFHHRDTIRPEDVLVVGPHPTFIHYIGGVLPGLGDGGVVLRDLGQLAPPVRSGRREPVPVSRLKGEARMAGLLARALAGRIGTPEPAERLLLAGRFVTLPGVAVAGALADCRAGNLPYAPGRQLLRDRLAALVRERGGPDPTGQDPLANLVERLWPQQSAAGFLRDLLGSRRRLRAAAGGAFTDDEQDLLYRRGADRLSEEVWSAADLPLLDEAEHLIGGAGRRYAHVVVDEAQDLSPMQLRSVARRSATGSLTVVGDLAQSTGPWARDSWSEVTGHLPAQHPVAVAPLRYGYRVPRQAYQLAARLLPVAAPEARAPELIRDGPADPRVHRVELADRAGRVAAVASRYAAAGQLVGVICPARCRRELEAALAADGVTWSSAARGELGSAVNLVSPQEAKGLEFDAVVVVEPEQVVAEDPRGHRLLYVALTRTTRYLDIVCVGEPVPLDAPPPPAPDPVEDGPGFTDRDGRRLAGHLAGQLRSAAPERVWPQVLAELARQLDLAGPDQRPGPDQ
jgi:DNA helicase IV